jgi:hypothetical protein
MAGQDEPVLTPAQPGTPAPPDSLGLFGILRSVAEIAGVFTGLGFIAGWFHLSSYYSAFGLNPLELDFSVTMISAFAVEVLCQSPIPLIVLLVALLAATLFVFLRKSLYKRGGSRSKVLLDSLAVQKHSGLWVRMMLAVLAVGMGITGWTLGHRKAVSDWGCSSGLPSVAFLTDPKDAPKLEDGAAECIVDNKLSCRLLLHSKGTYYFFQPLCDPDNRTSQGTGSMIVFQLPDSQVRMVRVNRSFGQ